MPPHQQQSETLAERVVTGSVPRAGMRWSQIVVCNLLSLMEAALLGLIGFVLVSETPGVPVPHSQALFVCIFISLTLMFFAARYGSASYEGFFSRRALFPGATAAATLGGLAEALLGGSLYMSRSLYTPCGLASISREYRPRHC